MRQYTEVDLNTATSTQSEENGSEVQLATAYIIYMMVGSFFKSCHVQSELRINSLYVHYSEMRINSQLSVERRVEWDFSEHFSEYLPIFSESRCEASVHEDGDKLCIEFNTGLERLTAIIDTDGQYEFSLAE